MADIITGTPPDLTYGHWLVQQAWMVVWAITSAALVVILGWMGLSFIISEHLGTRQAGWREMVPRLLLGLVAAASSLWWCALVLDVADAVSGFIAFSLNVTPGDMLRSTLSTLMTAVQAGSVGMALLLAVLYLVYGFFVLYVIVQMVLRLALIDILLALAPIALGLWILPHTAGWGRHWLRLFMTTVFQQAVQLIALAPVQTRLSYYASSKRARAILGQPRSTIDMRRTIHDGGILLVSTAQGKAGRDVAALVGASLLNLVDAVIREQGSLPFEQRRGALVVVDEMQSMPGVDYESMLSELGKFGASFVLATQSLAKLDDLSRTMRDSLLANVGCLAVFQVAGNDARQLVWELGKERVTEDDITSLPVNQCYVRATVGTERMDAFSMKVAKPEPGDADTAERIRDLAESYLTPASDIERRDAEMQDLVDRYREELEKLRKAQDTETAESGGQSQEQARRKQRSKRDQNPGDDAPETADGTADEELEE